MSSQRFGRPEILLSVAAASRSGSALFAPDRSYLDLLLMSQSFVYLGLVSFVPDLIKTGPALPLHSLVCLGSAFSSLFSTCSGFFTPALDCQSSGSSLSVQGLVRIDVSLFVLHAAHLDVALFLHSYAKAAVPLLLCGAFQIGPSLSVPDSSFLGVALPPRAPSRPGTLISTLDFADSESVLFSRDLVQVDSLLLLFGCGKSDFFPFALDFLHPDLLLLSHSTARVEFLPFAPDFTHLEALLLLRKSL